MPDGRAARLSDIAHRKAENVLPTELRVRQEHLAALVHRIQQLLIEGIQRSFVRHTVRAQRKQTR